MDEIVFPSVPLPLISRCGSWEEILVTNWNEAVEYEEKFEKRRKERKKILINQLIWWYTFNQPNTCVFG